MATQTLVLELPEEILQALGSVEMATAKVRESVVLDLLRDAMISQGKVARLLGITRRDLLDLMVRRQVPSGPETLEELAEEIEALRRTASA